MGHGNSLHIYCVHNIHYASLISLYIYQVKPVTKKVLHVSYTAGSNDDIDDMMLPHWWHFVKTKTSLIKVKLALY